jgi:hypothetical protein
VNLFELAKQNFVHTKHFKLCLILFFTPKSLSQASLARERHKKNIAINCDVCLDRSQFAEREALTPKQSFSITKSQNTVNYQLITKHHKSKYL